MDGLREMVQGLEAELEKVREEKNQLSQKLNEINREKAAIKYSSGSEEYNKAKKELLNSLDEQGKSVLRVRSSLTKKIKHCKVFAGLFFVVFCLLSAYIFYIRSITSIGTYLITAAVGILVCVIFAKAAQKPYKRKLKTTYDDPHITEYDMKLKELLKQYQETWYSTYEHKQQLDKEECEIRNKLREKEKIEKSLLFQKEELAFNFQYKDTILFYGKDKGNYYEIYIDSLLYDTVRGHKIVPILLTPGLHSFKVNNTCYNIDGSTIYSYTFNTRQIVVGEEIESYPIVCEYN